MKSTVLASFDHTYLTIIALFLFITLFVGVLWWITRSENKKIYLKTQNLPLEEGNQYEQ